MKKLFRQGYKLSAFETIPAAHIYLHLKKMETYSKIRCVLCPIFWQTSILKRILGANLAVIPALQSVTLDK